MKRGCFLVMKERERLDTYQSVCRWVVGLLQMGVGSLKQRSDLVSSCTSFFPCEEGTNDEALNLMDQIMAP
jgi:hypothetical protein